MNHVELSDLLQTQRHDIARNIFDYDLKHFAQDASHADRYLLDTEYTLLYLSMAIRFQETLLFENYMSWFGKLAYHLGFNNQGMATHLKSLSHILVKTFSETSAPLFLHVIEKGVQAYYQGFQEAKHLHVEIDPFLELLIEMKSDEARIYMLRQIESGKSVASIYLDIIQPTMVKVGLLWQSGRISVAKEHYITALIQQMIGQMYPYVFTRTQASDLSMTAVCSGNELHEIGMRMVADFFEMDGWDTTFLGSNIPASEILKTLINTPSDVLAISATTSSHLDEVAHLLSLVRQEPSIAHIRIIVGGKVFNDTPDLWKKIGADGFADNAKHAIAIARELVSRR
ncbi:MAG: cobalamin-dependent protein [Candidatus Izemoplasmatales bacterium]|jgi:methanogenic corrinoid protein MtbC1